MRSTSIAAVAALAFLLTACGGSDESGGTTAMVSVATEAAGPHCAAGGQAIQSGLDDDRNGTLDADEYASTRYVCSSTGVTPVITVADEAAGANCSSGGKVVTTRLDTNANDSVGASEAIATNYVCNGIGTDPQGTTGPNGTSNLSMLTALPVVGDTHCPSGGARMDSGFDNNRNGTLDAWEVATRVYGCSDGSHSTVTIMSNSGPVGGVQ